MTSPEDGSERSTCPAAAGDDARLAGMSLADTRILAKPNDYYRALRIGDPVHFDEKLGMYLVSRYEDLQTVLQDPITFSQEQGYYKQYAHGFLDDFKAILERDGGGYFPDVIIADPPRHARIRHLLEKAFTARRMKMLEPTFETLVVDLINGLAAKEKADGIRELSMPMTIGFMSRQLGLGNVDVDRVQRWTTAYTAQFSLMQTREQVVANAREVCDLQNYIIARVRERYAERHEDMISDLIYARLDDEENPTLTYGETVSLTRALLIGGNDTIATALSNLLFVVATDSQVAAQFYACAEDDLRLTRFIEELLRLEPPVRALSRLTTKDVDLGGKVLPAGAHLLLLYASGNDDEKVFSRPRSFDMNRRNIGRHMSFGAGIHLCVGMALARMELKVAAREIARRLVDIKLAVPIEDIRYLPTVATLTLESLPLRFSRRR